MQSSSNGMYSKEVIVEAEDSPSAALFRKRRGKCIVGELCVRRVWLYVDPRQELMQILSCALITAPDFRGFQAAAC
jgi:hypothetical protein